MFLNPAQPCAASYFTRSRRSLKVAAGLWHHKEDNGELTHCFKMERIKTAFE
jgi:hypothetical protein